MSGVVLLDRETASAAETEALGRGLGQRLTRGGIWLLRGELGAGKTVLVRGICRGLGVVAPVRSASFMLLVRYEGRLPIHHIDLYRLERLAEIEALDWEALAPPGTVVLVEWGERALALVGPDRLEAELEHRGPERRRVRLEAFGGEVAAARTLNAHLGAALLEASPPPC